MSNIAHILTVAADGTVRAGVPGVHPHRHFQPCRQHLYKFPPLPFCNRSGCIMVLDPILDLQVLDGNAMVQINFVWVQRDVTLNRA